MRRFLCLLALLSLAACAAYDGRGVAVAGAPVGEVERTMGSPAMRWQEADGGEVLVYPRGPQGFHTWFIRTDAGGRVVSRENVLEERHFAQIRSGMTGDEVMRLIGPPVPHWTVYFAARDELVWEWRYCDDWNEPARFNVLFDGGSGRVRSTMAASESLRGLDVGDHLSRLCGH